MWKSLQIFCPRLNISHKTKQIPETSTVSRLILKFKKQGNKMYGLRILNESLDKNAKTQVVTLIEKFILQHLSNPQGF